MIAEVQTFESSLLGEEDDHYAAGPVQSLSEKLFNSKLVFSN